MKGAIIELRVPESEKARIERRAQAWGLGISEYVAAIVRGLVPPTEGQNSRAIERLRRTPGADPERHRDLTLERARKTARRGSCSICRDGFLFTWVRDLREQGYSYARIARSTGLSHWSVVHHEPHRLILNASPEPEVSCVVCRLGTEICTALVDGRRRRLSVAALAVSAGTSRAAMSKHLRTCVPVAVLGLAPPTRSGPKSYRPQAVERATARMVAAFSP